MKSIVLSILIVFLLIINCNKTDAGNNDNKGKQNTTQVTKNSNQAAKQNNDANVSQKQHEPVNASASNSKPTVLPQIIIEGVF